MPVTNQGLGATFSKDRKYRYLLWRMWSPNMKIANFVLLNPSTADETVNDPTVERCERRARSMMYGGMYVTNIFSFRATDPNVMLEEEDPIGPDNDIAIIDAALKSDLVVCGWGQHGTHMDRASHVEKMLRERAIILNSLGLTKSGMPRHPLYISYAVTPTPWLVPSLTK